MVVRLREGTGHGDDMPIVGIDENTLYLAVVAPMAVTFGLGFAFALMHMGPVARRAYAIKRKKMSYVLHIGRDRVAQLVGAKRGGTGNYHAGVLEIIGDKAASFPFMGSLISVAHTSSASLLNPDFIEKANQILTANPTLQPTEIADKYELLEKQKKQLLKEIEIVKSLETGAVTIEELAKKTNWDEDSQSRYRAELTDIMGLGSERLETELEKVQKALEVTIEHKDLHIQWLDSHGTPIDPKDPDLMKKKVNGRLVETTVLRYDDFEHFLPIGANLDDVYTTIKRSESAAIKESEFSPNQAFKWIAFGVVIFLVFLGIYVVLTGLHI